MSFENFRENDETGNPPRWVTALAVAFIGALVVALTSQPLLERLAH